MTEIANSQYYYTVVKSHIIKLFQQTVPVSV